MRKKYFLAILAAVAISMSCVTPAMVSATEVEDTSDMIDDEQAEGEQTTVAAPGAETDSGDSSGSSGSGSSGSSGSGSGGSSASGSSSAGTNTSGSAGSTSGSTKSSDSSLAHLGISPGSLNPAFSAGTHEYSATVDAGVTRISVAARPNSSKAVIASVNGAKSLKPGTNKVTVVVEAENGATSTYTINVTCGSATTGAPASEAENAPATEPAPVQEDVTDDPSAEDAGQSLEGEISAINDTETAQGGQPEVTFDDNGYLIYEGNAYLPSSMMPEGEYVSLDKYNRLYEQIQAQKTKNMRFLIICVVVIALLLIVVLNLVLKLRDMRQDVRMGFAGLDDDEEPEKRQRASEPKQRKEETPKNGKSVQARQTLTDTSMIPDVKLSETMNDLRIERPSRPAKDIEIEIPRKSAKNAKTEIPQKPVKEPKTEKQQKPAASTPVKPAKSAKKIEDLEILDLNDL